MISKIRERMSPPIPLIMRIIILFVGGWNIFNVSLGIIILILKSIGRQIILNSHWFLKDEKAIDWREGFPNFHWTRRIRSRKGHGRLTKRKVVFCVLFAREKRGK
jgi:hypothetical protein